VVATPSTSNQPSGGVLNGLQPAHQSFRDAEEQRVAIVQATGDERLDCIYNVLLVSSDNDQRLSQLPQLVVAALTECGDVSRQRQLVVDDDAEVTGCVLDSETRRQNAHMANVKLGELLT